MFFKKGVIKNFAIFTGKHLCWSLSAYGLNTERYSVLVLSSEYCEVFKNTY